MCNLTFPDMYCKLFSSLYQGTLRGKSHEILVFTNLLAHCDRHGNVDKHYLAIAQEVGLTVEDVKRAIAVLEAPDPESRSNEHGGARLQRLDGHREWGWNVVNYLKYRSIINEDDRRSKNAHYQAEFRKKSKILSEPVRFCKSMSELSAQGEGEGNKRKRESTSPYPRTSTPVGALVQGTDVHCQVSPDISSDESKHDANETYHPDTRFILHKLNELTGKRFREADSSLSFISARLKEPGVDKNAVVTMLERMAAIWKGTDMAEYLRPATLFNKTKFESYYAARNQPINRRHNPNSALGADEFSVAGRDQRIAEYAELDRLEADKLAAGELDDPFVLYGPKPGQKRDLEKAGAPNGRARSEGAQDGNMG